MARLLQQNPDQLTVRQVSWWGLVNEFQFSCRTVSWSGLCTTVHARPPFIRSTDRQLMNLLFIRLTQFFVRWSQLVKRRSSKQISFGRSPKAKKRYDPLESVESTRIKYSRIIVGQNYHLNHFSKDFRFPLPPPKKRYWKFLPKALSYGSNSALIHTALKTLEIISSTHGAWRHGCIRMFANKGVGRSDACTVLQTIVHIMTFHRSFCRSSAGSRKYRTVQMSWQTFISYSRIFFLRSLLVKRRSSKMSFGKPVKAIWRVLASADLSHEKLQPTTETHKVIAHSFAPLIISYSTRNMQNIDEHMLLDLFEESHSEVENLFFCEHETYDTVPTTHEMNQQEEDEVHSVLSSSTQNSDGGEEFDLNPIPCYGSEQLIANYLSIEGFSINYHDNQDNRPSRAVSPGSESSTESSVTPNYMMAKLAECMERSAFSRSLVENFCQSSLKASASKETIQVSTSKKAVKKKTSQGCIQDKKISVVKASSARSTKKNKMGSSLRIKSKNQKPSISVVSSHPSSKKNDDFRASGLKVSTKSLIAKFKWLESDNQDDGNHKIASFLRREKFNSLLDQLSPRVAIVWMRQQNKANNPRYHFEQQISSVQCRGI